MITISRWYKDNCTLGTLEFKGFRCFTLELPDKNNEQSISCIPEGVYKFHARLSDKNGFVLELEEVPNRAYIQVHAGNYTSQIEGCILVGDSIKHLNSDNIPDITNSKKTLKKLLELIDDENTIEIRS